MPWDGGRYYYSPGLIRAILQNIEELKTSLYDHGDPNTEMACMVWDVECAMIHAGITRRQHQVLELIGHGLQPLHIAYILGISTGSVYSHLRRVIVRLESCLNSRLVDNPPEGHIG